MSELAVNQPGQLAVAPSQKADLGALLAAVIQGGDITPDKVALAERLMDLKWKSEARDAETAFNVAMFDCQKETGKIPALREIRDSSGVLRSRHAKHEDIDAIAGPIIERHGFAVSYKQGEECDGKTLVVICIVRHSAGHKEEFPYRVGILPPKGGNNEAQASTSTNSYGKRVAFCNAFNIRIDTSDDAFLKGAPIPIDVAANLEERARIAIEENPDIRSTEARLLTLCQRAGADAFAQIAASKVAFVEGLIEKLSLAKPKQTNPAAQEAATVKPEDPDLFKD